MGAAVAAGEVKHGVIDCYTGTGVSITANKVPGVYAALTPVVAAALRTPLVPAPACHPHACGRGMRVAEN